jgi:hypothetical protein
MSSKIKQRPFKIVPIPDDTTKFTSNRLVIEEAIFDENDYRKVYDHIGEYLVSASSYSDKDHMPYNVFNGGGRSWKTNYADNKYVFTMKESKTPSYCTDPYNSSKNGPSSYQGGGSSKTKYTTNVDNKEYNGEWIQIQLPTTSPIYLFRYSILTPVEMKISVPNIINDGFTEYTVCTFPRSFLVAGSKDGNKWTFLDLQALPLDNPPNTSDRKPRIYDINTSDYYRYLRFIFIDMFPNNKLLEISQINLFGFIEITPNRNAIEEGFANIDSGISYSGFEISKVSDETSKQLQHLKHDHIRETVTTPTPTYSSTSNIYIPLFLTVIVGSMLIFRAIRK